MALFSNKTNKSEKTGVRALTSSNNEAISSILAQEMTITGEISFRGKARIDGTLEGNCTGEHLILSETGKIQGDLTLESLVCHGKIMGNVSAKQVTVHSSAAIQGKLVAGSLTVESGALLAGEISAADDVQNRKTAAAGVQTEKVKPPIAATEAEKKEVSKGRENKNT